MVGTSHWHVLKTHGRRAFHSPLYGMSTVQLFSQELESLLIFFLYLWWDWDVTCLSVSDCLSWFLISFFWNPSRNAAHSLKNSEKIITWWFTFYRDKSENTLGHPHAGGSHPYRFTITGHPLFRSLIHFSLLWHSFDIFVLNLVATGLESPASLIICFLFFQLVTQFSKWLLAVMSISISFILTLISLVCMCAHWLFSEMCLLLVLKLCCLMWWEEYTISVFLSLNSLTRCFLF